MTSALPPGIPTAATTLFTDLLAAPRRPADELRAELTAHVARVAEAAKHNEVLDPSLANAIEGVCRSLLDEAEARGDADVHALVQAAVLYFVSDEDAESDLDSDAGLDDDGEVCNAVARQIGRADLVVPV